MNDRVVNVVFAGLGGQGVIKASDILAHAAFESGRDVKKSELHGMSQRGGSVTSDVRFGPSVLSPMVPAGQADFVVVSAVEEVEAARRHLRPGGTLIGPDAVDAACLPGLKTLNVALLGVLSRRLTIDEPHWVSAIRGQFAERLHEPNLRAFAAGREAAGGA